MREVNLMRKLDLMREPNFMKDVDLMRKLDLMREKIWNMKSTIISTIIEELGTS